MAVIHRATLRPTKTELLTDWLPGRAWCTGPSGEVRQVASFRFDDPAGAVGIETILVRAGDGPVLQVPLTYRDTPLSGGDDWLVCTTEHSVLGKRWVYDGIGDPVYVQALVSAILENSGQAEQLVRVDDRLEPRAFSMGIASSVRGGTAAPAVGPVARVAGDDPAVVVTESVELAVVRDLDAGRDLTGAVLTGTWPGRETPVPLAAVSAERR